MQQERRFVNTGLPSRTCLRTSLRHCLLATSGNVTLLVALALPALLGAVGVAVDFAQFGSKTADLQAIADAAAIAAAKELSISSTSDAEVSAAAKVYVDTLANDSVSAAVEIDRKLATVSVTVSEEWTPAFAHFLGADITPVFADATATLVGQGSVCVLTLDPSASGALSLDNKSTISAEGCGVYVNSSDGQAIEVKNNSRIKAETTCSVGGVFNKGTITPAAITDCPKATDPLTTRTSPAVGSCDYHNKAIKSGSVTLSPGVYCGGLEISGGSNVTFSEGTYIIKDGKLTLRQSASVTGENVGFYLTGKGATLDFSGSSSVNFSGPRDGAMAGLLFFGDRKAASIETHVISSANAHTMTGTIYFPRGNLLVDPGSKVGQNSAYTVIIANAIVVDMGPELVLNSNYDTTDVPVPDGIKAMSDVVLSN
jgi:Flp pilus assembly protein TadG